MKTLHKSIIIGLTVLGLGATTLSAQAEDARPGQHQGHAKWAERVAAHQHKLREQLKLTPSQDAAWAAYTTAIKPAARGERGERSDWIAMPAPQRMEKRIEMAKQHVSMMETRLAALNTFYAVLTPEQKKVFDANSVGHGGRHMRHHKLS
jgi:periplasmic protein CpxP/Spy